MSRLNRIQQEILALSGGEFQKLCDAYLFQRGYTEINAIGSVAGANKVAKGTPDTLISIDEGMYVFAEYTTQKDKVYEKILDDLEKCFDVTKTGIPTEKIHKIIVCFTARLNSEEEEKLRTYCSSKKVELELCSITKLSFDLQENHHGLVKDFLGISIGTGQILRPERFVKLYSKNALTTRLDHKFYFRENEISTILEGFKTKDLIVLSGKAGVGKSRIALEICKRFADSHPEFEVRCILNKSIDLREDLQMCVLNNRNYFIFVDDANEVQRFDDIIELLQENDNQNIKVIATVRDYALGDIQKSTRVLKHPEVVTIKAFTNQDIETFICGEYPIMNSVYLERICYIAKGNARLAVMAAEAALEHKNLKGIDDVSGLYDRYFTSIREKLSLDADSAADMFKVAAVIAFCDYIDYTDEEVMDLFRQVIPIAQKDFEKHIDKLYELGIVDIYEKTIVKISDQVFSTYLFYLSFFKEKTIDFQSLLNTFFTVEKYRHRFRASVYPVVNDFSRELVVDVLKPCVTNFWQQQQSREIIAPLLEIFWFVDPTPILGWAKRQIEGFSTENIPLSDITFRRSENAISDKPILKVLGMFSNGRLEERNTAVELLLKIAVKTPSRIPAVLYMLTSHNVFGIRSDSYLDLFQIQTTIISIFQKYIDRCEEEDTRTILSRILMIITSAYLKIFFRQSGMNSPHSMYSKEFIVHPIKEFLSLRSLMWEYLFSSYANQDADGKIMVLHILHDYIYNAKGARNQSNTDMSSDTIKHDAAYIVPFIQSSFDADNYDHCIVVHAYFCLLTSQRLSSSALKN